MPVVRALALLLVAASGAAAQTSTDRTYAGALEPGDTTLTSGEFVDEYVVEARAGETVRAVVTSGDFDTYVIVQGASGAQAEDDDCTDGETTRSCVDWVADADGPVRVLVTSFGPGETGAYEVSTQTGTSLEPLVTNGDALGDGDLRLQTGEWYDPYRVTLERGERRRITVTSAAFDTYLVVTGPGDARIENDACADGRPDRSCVEVVADEPGDWRIVVTSARPGQGGPYTLGLIGLGADDPEGGR